MITYTNIARNNFRGGYTMQFSHCAQYCTVYPELKEANEARVIDVKITWVSNYRCPISKSSNRTAVIGHPRDRAPITWQIGARRTNHDREFCYRYD